MNSLDPANPPSKYLNEKEVSELTGIAVKTLQSWRWQRVGPPFVKLQSAVRYPYVDLLDYLESNKTHTASAE